jgi:hypothetical protein
LDRAPESRRGRRRVSARRPVAAIRPSPDASLPEPDSRPASGFRPKPEPEVHRDHLDTMCKQSPPIIEPAILSYVRRVAG